MESFRTNESGLRKQGLAFIYSRRVTFRKLHSEKTFRKKHSENRVRKKLY